MTSKLAKPTHLPKPTGRTHVHHDDDPVTLAVRRLSEEVAKRRVSENDPLHTSALRRLSEDTRRDSIPEDNTAEWLLARRMSEAGISRKGSDASVILTENTDSFIIGDRVYVNGVKPGYIQYIGETQFAPGEWAGIVLDKALGKNDGSVSGVRYFMCEPKRGVFSRLTRLTRQPLVDGDLSELEENINEYHISPKTSVSERPDMRKASIATSDIKVGDRVVVFSNTGTKTGYLRYVGNTNFAQGEWAGVELDEPLGKNDGSVAGKRYFECTNKFGLFAPVHKVSKVGSRASSSPKSSVGLYKTASKESLDSSASLTSGVRSPRKTTPGKANSTPTNATTNALQEALREKEEHVDQLLKERDLERGEIARAASQIESKEKELCHLKLQYEHVESKVVCLEDQLSLLRNENGILREALEDEKRKLEEIEFRLAEETINVGAIEDEDQNISRIRDLEKKLKIEQAKVETLEKESNKCFELTEQLTIQKEEIESLKTELGTLRDGNISTDNGGVQQVQSELSQMREMLKALEDQLNQSRADHEEKDKLIFDFQAQLNNSICEETEELKSNLSTVEIEKEKLLSLLGERDQAISCMESEKQLMESSLMKSKADWELEKDELLRKKDLEIYELQEQNMTLESKLSDLQERLSDLELQCKQAVSKSSDMPELENRFEMLRAEKQKAVEDKEEVLKQKAELELEKARLETENINWKKCHEENSLKVTERDQKLTLLTQEVNRLRDTFSSHKKELESELEQSQQEAGAMEDLRCRLEAQQGELDRLQEALQESENLREQAETDKSDLAQKLESAQAETSQIKEDSERYLQLHVELENELRNLKMQLEERTGKMTEQQLLTAQLTNRISELEAKCTATESVNGNEETNSSTAPSQDKEAMTSQINFLNSVIVDMHKKNDELKARLEILQADPSSLNNNIETKKKPIHVAPRLFCDICERFDIHDTEDCPKQVLSDNGPQPHQGDRNIERPYCDSCEVFGHSTSNCDDDKTF